MNKKQKKEDLESSILKGDNCYKALDFDEAIKYYEKAISINPQSALAWNGKGLSLISKGQLEPV